MISLHVRNAYLAKTMATLSQKTNLVARWRDDFVKAMHDFQGDSPPTSWSDVFVPQSHYKALLPQTMLVEGMRGAGKSFWTRVLYDKELRAATVKAFFGIKQVRKGCHTRLA